MINVLIVDDEPTIRKGIRSILSKHAGDEYCWFEAENGFDALNICKKHKPEIVITDLHLPLMDGLEFIKTIKKDCAQSVPSFIIVTGYDDFNYAKTAIKLGVVEYLLKPIKREELIDTFMETVSSINLNKQNKIIKIENEILKHENLELNKRKSLNILTSDYELDEKSKVINFLVNNHLLVHSNFYQCLACQMQDSDLDIDKISLSCNELVSSMTANSVTFYDNHSNVIVILSGEDKLDLSLQAERIVNNLGSHLIKHHNVVSFLGIGGVVDNILNIDVSYNQAIFACLHKITASTRHYYWEEKDLKRDKKSNTDFITNLPIFIEMGDFDSAIGLINDEINKAKGNFSQLYLLYENIDYVVKMRFSNWMEDKDFVLNKLSCFWNVDQLKDYLNKYIFRFCKEVQKSHISCEQETVLKVLKFVSDHYKENINLNMVSNVLDKNSSYLSTLIKKETGEKFTDILLKYKINYAKELLQEVNYSINEVSAKCGFVSTKHFISVFKKMTGKRPTQYRVERLRNSTALPRAQLSKAYKQMYK
ncbi:MAG: response regulator [Christensenellales bacterium]|jgi:two-component system response regulator YesN